MDQSASQPARDYRTVGKRVSNWGRWGTEDERGTLNYVGPKHVVDAARLIRRGDIFDLGIAIEANGPSGLPGRTNPIHLMSEAGGAEQDYPGGIRWSDDYIFMPTHAATQWDAFSHVWYDDQLYNGHPASSVTERGARKCAIDKLAKGVVGRGVLLDLARFFDVEWLEGGYVITPDDFENAMAHQGVELRSGDVLLFRTGWRKKFLTERSAIEWMASEPGIGVGAAEWIHAREISALCSDNWGIEVIPNEDPDFVNPVHCLLLRDIGVPLGEIFDLEELAEDCASDGVYEFFFSAPPLKITGGVGSPINPLAIK